MRDATTLLDAGLIGAVFAAVVLVVTVAVYEDLPGQASAQARTMAVYDPDREVRIHVVCITSRVPFNDISVVKVNDDGSLSEDTRRSNQGSNMVAVPVGWRYRIIFQEKLSDNELTFQADAPPDMTVNCKTHVDGRQTFSYARA